MHVDLEVEVATDTDCVARLPHRTDPPAGVDTLAALDQRRSRHVGVEVAAPLPFAVDQYVVAVEHRVMPIDGEDVVVVGNTAVGRDDASGGWCSQGREKEKR
jgi:hypothetical protein